LFNLGRYRQAQEVFEQAAVEYPQERELVARCKFKIADCLYQQGESVRIMYVHVPAAWMALFAYTFLAAASAVALIWKHPLADVAAKAAAGALERVRLYLVTNLAQALRRLQDHGVWVYGASAGDPPGVSPFGRRYPPALCLVLGGEAKGLRPVVRKACDELLTIPMASGVDCLIVGCWKWTDPMLAMRKPGSMTQRTTSCPSIRAVPQTAASLRPRLPPRASTGRGTPRSSARRLPRSYPPP